MRSSIASFLMANSVDRLNPRVCFPLSISQSWSRRKAVYAEGPQPGPEGAVHAFATSLADNASFIIYICIYIYISTMSQHAPNPSQTCITNIIKKIKNQARSTISSSAGRMTLCPVNFKEIVEKNDIDTNNIFVNSGLSRIDVANNVPVFKAIVQVINCGVFLEEALTLDNLHKSILEVLCAQNASTEKDLVGGNGGNGCLWQQYQLLAEDLTTWTDRDYVACPILLFQKPKDEKTQMYTIWKSASILHEVNGGKLIFPIMEDTAAGNLTVWDNILNNANTYMICGLGGSDQEPATSCNIPSQLTSAGPNCVDIPILRQTFGTCITTVEKTGKTHYDKVENLVKKNFIQRWEFDFSDISRTKFFKDLMNNPKELKEFKKKPFKEKKAELLTSQKNVIVMGQGEIIQMTVRTRDVWWDNVNLDNGVNILINNGFTECKSFRYGKKLNLSTAVLGGPLFVDPQIYKAAMRGSAKICAVLTLGAPGLAGTLLGNGCAGQTPGHILSIIKTENNTYSIGFGYGRTGEMPTLCWGDHKLQQCTDTFVSHGGGGRRNVVQRGGGPFTFIPRIIKRMVLISGNAALTVGDKALNLMPFGKNVVGWGAKKVVPKIAMIVPGIWNGVHEDLQGSIGGPDFTWSDKFSKYPSKYPGLEIVGNKIYDLEKVQGSNDDLPNVYIKRDPPSSSSSPSASACQLSNTYSFNNGLENVFAVQMHKIMLVHKPGVGIFFVAPRAYNFLTSNNYSALSSPPNQADSGNMCSTAQNCSGWQLGLFGGIISLDSSDGALCSPNNPQLRGNEGKDCNDPDTIFGGKKTKRKRKKKKNKTKKRK
jgi:hypothetical protein